LSERLTDHTDVAGFVLGRLEPDERDRFEHHLAGCGECQAALRELAPVSELVAAAAPAVNLPAGLEARVLAAVEEEARRTNGHAEVPLVDASSVEPGRRRMRAPEPTGATRERRRPARRRLLAPRRLGLALAACAALALAVVGGVRLADSGTQPPLELAATLEAPGAGGAQARAEVTETGIGRVIEFRSDDLAILPKGEYYELWFVGPGDSRRKSNRISAGTFHPDPEGRSHVSFAAAVDPAKYPVLSVTAEPGDGDPRPSRREVLRSR